MMDSIYCNIGLTIFSVVVGLWGIWYFLLIPKLKYKTEIFTLIRPTTSLDDKLRILFTNKPVNELSIVCISIYNAGLGTADNFTTPITIHSNKQILDVQLNKDAINCKVIKRYKISKDKKSIDLYVGFINRSEEFTCYCVIEGTDDIDISVSGRCKGCSKIKPAFMINWKYVNEFAPWLLMLLFSLSIVIGATLLKSRVRSIDIKLKGIDQNISQQVSDIKKTNNSIKLESEK